MFGAQRIRLLRKEWTNLQEFVEELYSMFSDEIALSHNGPITLNLPEDATFPPLTINASDDNQDLIRYQRRGVDIGTVTLDDDSEIDNPGTVASTSTTTTQATVFRGTIVSGSGTSYTVSLSSGNVTATQSNIDSAESIPTGTPVWVLKSGGAYYLNVPVWL